VQIAAVQTDVTLADKSTNLAMLETTLRAEAAAGSRLVIFPECFLTGYCFDSPDEARELAETVPGPAVQQAADLCSELNVFCVFGMLEWDGDDLFNVAVVVGPSGFIGKYRKTHLPYLGVDRFTTPGEQPWQVFDLDGLRLGMLICYDGGFPEPVRALALAGADLVVLPTNWPPGAELMAEHAVATRAMENNIYFAAVNRIGTERGFRFIGASSICDPTGKTMAAFPGTEAGVLHAAINPEAARNKRIVRVPAKHIIDRMADRRPDLYGPLCEPHQLPRPGRDEQPPE
jgi:predicted amidohydrolase